MATIRKRPGPGGKTVWQAQIIRKGYERQYRTFDTKTQAEAWARDVEGEMDSGRFVSRTEAEATTLGQALDRYASVSAQKKDAKREKNRLIALRNLPLARKSLANIRGKDIAAFIAERQAEGKGANTIRLDLALLSHLFNTARTAWGMESLSNPVDLVKGQRPKLPQGRTRRLGPGEQDRLLANAKDMEPIITWAIETAMRRSEIAGLRWADLDLQTKVATLTQTKNGTVRRVPLSSRAIAALDDLPPFEGDCSVFSMQPDSITQAFERVCKEAGIQGLTFHDLRHEATSRLFERGLNPMQVAAITGHKTLQMLKRYTHLRAEDLVGLLG